MLRGLDPLLSPDLLHMLAAMGHGDDLVIADANFPAESCARRLVRLDGVTATGALNAVLGLLPLDTFVDDPARVMGVVGDPEAVPPVVAEFQTIIDQVADAPAPIRAVDRFDFYDVARAAFGVVLTGETRLYGNIIVKKGVVAPSDGGAQ
ncbi:RbsD/FucU family protein [Oceanomicrobium pacificus]|uniref:Ribose ABC transporter n=1 Tax=Oceanomicrobium pacificus TaxID=2692916 RepID=A0A6B0TZS5_9RHOB|nr:RbsD/FucU domain-containing protein [Oceanomicrobium pacificus]MXU66762.1 ribose ABC transporter [Oceanomicrobium pacificus]